MMPISDAERWRWQRQAVRVLDELLELAEANQIPPVTWRLTTGMGLSGYVGPIGAAGDRRAVWSAWVEWMGLDARPEFVSSTGTHRLFASGRFLAVRGMATPVSVTVEFFEGQEAGDE